MPNKAPLRTGGQVLVAQLAVHGVDLVFCVPGESYLDVLDALHDARDGIRLVTCRHEAAACTMAEAYGKLTGRPGVCFVTRGPGASHGMIGVHTAWQDCSPLVLFVGQVARGATGREALQEIDTKAMFGHTAKWAADINDAARMPELVSRAFHTAVAGRCGPVVVGLPEDMLSESCRTADVHPYRVVRPSPDEADLRRMRGLLAKARRPLVMVGGGGWSRPAVDGLRAFAEANNLPVCASFRCQDMFDNRHPNYVGDLSLAVDPNLAAKVVEADLLIAVGDRIGELSTQGYTLVTPPRPAQTLIHVHPSPDDLGRVFQGALLMASGMSEFAVRAAALDPVDGTAWDSWTKALRAIYEAGRVPGPCPGDLDLGRAVADLSDAVPADILVTSDGGNFAGWLNRFFQFSRYRSLLGPANGAMGYGVPAAITAKLVQPERPVLCFAGDGGFMMSGQELATAMMYGVNIVVLVFNNGLFGTIRMYQERTFPNRTPATRLVNPDFVAFARSFGAHGDVVERTEDFVPAVMGALEAAKPAVLDIRYDPEAITTRTTLSELRSAAERRQAREGSKADRKGRGGSRAR